MWITRKRELPHIPTAQQQQLFLTKFDGIPNPDIARSFYRLLNQALGSILRRPMLETN